VIGRGAGIRHGCAAPRGRGLAVAVAVLSLAGQPRLGAQQTAGGLAPGQRCIIDFQGSQDGRTTRSTFNKLPSGKYDVYIGGGFVGNCRGQDVTLRSDSAEYYGDQRLLYLIANVHYAEPRARVDADHMTYWMDQEHIRAEGNVFAVLHSGSTMRGPVADYYRAVAGIRTQAILAATGRPTLELVQLDSITQRPTDTVHVVAERITSVADSLVYAGGDVQITRPELLAAADSAFVDQGSGRARLLVHPSVEARRTRPFTLTGGVIDIFSHNRAVNRVVATPNGHATSEDVQLYADSVDLRVRANELERAMAWGKGRARAISPDRDIRADSIDALMPGQRLRRLVAVGDAYATSIPDTAVVHTAERDWMRGDTIVATFDTLSGGDTSHTPPIRTLVAETNARAYYHMQGRNHSDPRPAINYVRGRDITIAFANRQVHTVTVTDSASGLYIEPADTTIAAAPSATAHGAAPAGSAGRVPAGKAPPAGKTPGAPPPKPGGRGMAPALREERP